MAKKKWKKIAKNVGKAAVLAGALYGASKLGKRGVTGVVKPGTHPGDAFAKARKAMTSDAAYGKAPYTDAIRRSQKLTKPEDLGIMGYKKGGRTGKQFGGGLNRPLGGVGMAGGIGGVRAPVRPLGYKGGKSVKK